MEFFALQQMRGLPLANRGFYLWVNVCDRS